MQTGYQITAKIINYNVFLKTRIHQHNSGSRRDSFITSNVAYQDLATSPVLQKPSLWKNSDR